MVCESLSLTHICASCQELFFTPSLYKREIANNVSVFSFYKYGEIKSFIHTKHTDLGHPIFSLMAKNSFERFAQNFTFEYPLVSLSIDDTIQNGYSHTAILNKALTSPFITPLYNHIQAGSKVRYSGKSKAFRLANPREFSIREFREDEVILVDDIITTGTTLTQAIYALQAVNKKVLFCLTLADASQKEES
jgi:competence protein ComFC